ncbi:MAG: RNA-binding protein [Methylacidiphilales bacterium]|nr:RNA-binding protein [Candidatus Methylacidiphilales bacterium]
MNMQRSGRPRSGGGRRRRGGMRPHPGDRNRNPGQKPQTKTNPVIAFFSKLLGLGKKDNAQAPNRNRANGRPDFAARSERQPRPESNEKPEVLTPRLYIGNLPYETSESDLFDHFSKVGQVINVEIVRDARSNSKGFGFVEMGSLETAKEASEKYHRTDFMGRQIVVAGSKK